MNQTNKTPLISIIVPVYNAEKYIKHCIGSVVVQDYTNFELILIDDGSTDNSLNIINEFQYDNRVKIITISNAGVSNARNLGIFNSRGEYIMFIDSDDFIESNTLSSCIRSVLLEDTDLLFFGWNKVKGITKNKIIDLEKNSLKIQINDIEWLKRRTIGPNNIQLQENILIDLYNTPWAKLYKASIIKDSGILFKPRNIVGMEDVLFNIELFQHLKSVSFLRSYLYNYRVDSENSLTKIDVDNIDYKLKNLVNEIKLNVNLENIEELIDNRIKFSMINILVSLTSKHRNTNFIFKFNTAKKILNDPFYCDAFKNDFSNASPRLKVFFYLCKYKQSFILVLVMTLLHKIK